MWAVLETTKTILGIRVILWRSKPLCYFPLSQRKFEFCLDFSRGFWTCPFGCRHWTPFYFIDEAQGILVFAFDRTHTIVGEGMGGSIRHTFSIWRIMISALNSYHFITISTGMCWAWRPVSLRDNSTVWWKTSSWGEQTFPFQNSRGNCFKSFCEINTSTFCWLI